MKVKVVQAAPVYHIELSQEEACLFRMLLGSLSDSQIISLLGSGEYCDDIQKISEIISDLYEVFPSDTRNDLVTP